MNKITILAIGAVFAVSMIAITAFEAEAKPPSQVACPAENVQHWNTIIWSASTSVTHPTLPTINSGVLEIQVPSDKSYSGKGVVLSKLTELGYLDATSQPLDKTDINSALLGSSSTICAEN